LEPLTGFFILEGILFDIIGAYLIVSAIFSFRPNIKSESFKEYFLPVFTQILKKSLEDSEIGHYKTMNRNSFFKKIGLQLSEDNEFKESLRYMDIYKKDLEIEIREFTTKRAFSGLSFLIGGFLLQGIGVINQLLWCMKYP